jgi:hypothetical protein
MFPLKSIVTVVHNQGFKNCKKKLPMQIPICDLKDVFLYICMDAIQKKFNRILVLEDDFQVLTSEIRHFQSVQQFVQKHDPDVYNLGPVPNITYYPPILTHNRSLYFGTTHAIIYSHRYLQWVTERAALYPLTHIDQLFNNCNTSKYAYYIPLIGQVFEMTENRQYWTNIVSETYFKLLQLDTSCDNYQRSYLLLNWGVWFLLCILVVIVISIVKRITSHK